MDRFRYFFAYILGVDRRDIALIPDYRVGIVMGAIILMGLALIAGIVLFFKNREFFKKFILVALAAIGQYIITYIAIVVIESIVSPTRSVATGFNIALIFTALLLVSVLIITGALVAHFKKERFASFAKVALVAILVHSAVVLSAVFGQVTGIGGMATGYQVVAWIALALTVALAACVIIIAQNAKKRGKDFRHNETLSIAFAGVAIALSFALSYVRFFRMPTGGSVTLARLVPLALYAYIFGIKRGLLAGAIWGLLRLFVDPFIVHPMQFIIEYILSSMTIALAGIPRVFGKRLHPSVALGMGLLFITLTRYVLHTISGIIWLTDFVYGTPNAWLLDYGTNWAIVAWSLMGNAVQLADGAIAIAAAVLIMLSPQMQKLVRQTKAKFLNIAPRREEVAVEAAAVVDTEDNQLMSLQQEAQDDA